MDETNVQLSLQELPLLLNKRTYNTQHPEYRIWMTNNYPGKVYTHSIPESLLLKFPENVQWDTYKRLITQTRLKYAEVGTFYVLDRLLSRPPSDISNRLYSKLRPYIRFNRITPDRLAAEFATAWREIREDLPVSKEVFEARTWMENWIAELNDRSPGIYYTGWVSLDDAIFLYWAVRTLKPQTIVQTGVCNGLSCAFITMALERNGGEGMLHAVDFPQIYDPNDPAMNMDQIYGVIVPDGKRSGWIVPDALGGRFNLIEGMAEEKLPSLMQELGRIDMFYHDSDHSYDHMMFEMEMAKAHLNDGGVIICDDVSWTSSTWDFAKNLKAPAYNYRGSLGIIFL